MDIEFYESDFDSVYNSHEFRALIINNWVETGLDGITLSPDWDKYKQAYDNGMLRVYIAKAGDLIVGYSVYFVSKHLHYRESLQATCDMIFIRPTRRGFGKKFIAWIDEQLKNDGVCAVYRHASFKNKFGLLLGRMGYKEQEVTFIKRL